MSKLDDFSSKTAFSDSTKYTDGGQGMTPDCQSKCQTQRSSERLRNKSRKKFVRPSRKDVFDSIADSPAKIGHLQPRKLINNYTRETHYYNAEKGHDVFEDESSLSDFIVESDDNADYTSIDSHVENGKDTPEHSDTIESDTTLRGRYTGSKCISDSSSESDSSKGGDESEKISAGSRYLKKSYHQIAIPSDDDEQDKDDASRNLKQGSGTKRRYSYINSSTSSSESEQEGIRKVLADEGTDCDNEQVVKHSERNVKLCEQRREKKEQMFTKLREQRDRQRNKSASNKVT